MKREEVARIRGIGRVLRIVDRSPETSAHATPSENNETPTRLLLDTSSR